MTIEVKGFVQIPNFISNVTGSVAAVGELSQISRTFARDLQYHSDADKDVAELVIFRCFDDGVATVLPTEIRDLCLDIMEEAYNNFNTSSSFKDQLAAYRNDLTSLDTGTDKLHQGRQLTDWFSFVYTMAGEQVLVKLWLTDSSFDADYTDYEAYVVGPSVNVTDMASTYEVAKAAADSFTLTERFGAHSAIIDKSPATDTSIVELTWVDPTDPSNTFVTNWSIISYGRQGTIYENKIKAIRQYLEDNSSIDISVWATYFPDLDSVDTIYIFPQWENVALTSSVTPGVGDNQYSTFFKYDVGMDNARAILNTGSLTTVKKYSDVFSAVHKSIMAISIGKETNSIANTHFSAIHPKYTVLQLNDENKGRLPANTQTFITLYERALALCEVDTGSNELPAGYVRQVTNGAIFVEFVIDQVTYRVCTKASYLAIIFNS